MLINEIIKEYTDYPDFGDPETDAIVAVQDILALAMTKGIKKIPTDKFIALLSKKLDRNIDKDLLIDLVDKSGFASSASQTEIVPKGEMPADVKAEPNAQADIGKKAGDTALKNVKKDLKV